MLNKRIFLFLLVLTMISAQSLSAVLTLKEQAAHAYFSSRPLSAIKRDFESNKLNQEIQEALVPLVINKYKKQLDPHFCKIVKGPGLGTADAIVFSQCGNYVLTGFQNELYLWDLRTGYTIRRISHPGKACSVALSSDRRYALTSSWGNTAYLWDLSTGQLIKTFKGQEGYVGSGLVAFSPCNKYALLSSPKRIRRFNLETGEVVQILKDYTNLLESIPTSLALSQCGNYALIGCCEYDAILRPYDNYDSAAYLWDLHDPTVFTSLHGHTQEVKSVTFSPDSKYALTGSADCTVHLWDITAGQAIAVLDHDSTVISLAVSHCGNYALMGSLNNTAVGLWGLETDEFIELPTSKSTVRTVAFSQCGRYALAGYPDNTVHIWDLAYYKKTIFLKELLAKLNPFAYETACTIV